MVVLISDVLRIFVVVAVCARAFEERGFFRTVHLACITLKKTRNIRVMFYF